MTYPLLLATAVSLLLLFVAAYRRRWHRLRRLRREEELVMSRARQKAVAIVHRARDQALEIIGQARISAEKDQLKLGESLDKISAEHLREFQGLITSISKNIEIDALKEVEEFRQALELETVQSQQAVAEKLRQQSDQLELDLAAAQKKRLTELEARIGEVIADVAKQVTGQVIPLEDHERLIMAALQQAKKRHVL